MLLKRCCIHVHITGVFIDYLSHDFSHILSVVADETRMM
jgi:hypothetical protein